MADPQLLVEILKVIGKFTAAGGGGAAIAWLIFSKFGDRWLEQRFATRLEQFKHEKAQEIERLRHQITSVFSRISKIHDKEFEVLPAAFLKHHHAYGKCFRLGSALQQYPALNQMGASLFAEFVANCSLPEFRKKELLKATDREDYYNRWIFGVHFGEAQSAYDDFHNFLVMNRIFMTDDLRQQFAAIAKLISSVLIALEIDRQTPGSGLHSKVRKDLAEIEPLLEPLEMVIQKRLHYEEA
jgi:hypothetical protein